MTDLHTLHRRIRGYVNLIELDLQVNPEPSGDDLDALYEHACKLQETIEHARIVDAGIQRQTTTEGANHG